MGWKGHVEDVPTAQYCSRTGTPVLARPAGDGEPASLPDSRLSRRTVGYCIALYNTV